MPATRSLAIYPLSVHLLFVHAGDGVGRLGRRRAVNDRDDDDHENEVELEDEDDDVAAEFAFLISAAQRIYSRSSVAAAE